MTTSSYTVAETDGNKNNMSPISPLGGTEYEVIAQWMHQFTELIIQVQILLEVALGT